MNHQFKRKLYTERLESRELLAAHGLGEDYCLCEPAVCAGEFASSRTDLADADDSEVRSQRHQHRRLPFKGFFEANISSFTPVDESTAIVTFSVAGRGTRLGRFTGHATTTFNLVELAYQGTYHWTGQNGDQIFGTIAGTLTPTSTEGLFDNHETFTVDGGTGRLAAAIGGSGFAGGQINLSTGIANIPFRGRIVLASVPDAHDDDRDDEDKRDHD